MTPIEWARDALAALVTDESLAKRLHKALKRLRPLRSLYGYDTTIIQMLNDAGNANFTLKEKAKAVAELIETVFRMGDRRIEPIDENGEHEG
jgi:hypothetical protein